jgi:hypothetical protein
MKQMTKAEVLALRKELVAFVKPKLKRGCCPCCIGSAMVFAALDMGEYGNATHIIAAVMQGILDNNPDIKQKPQVQ